MGEVWQRINRNSGALVVLLMVVSIIVGPSVFVWTEVQVNSAEIRQLQEDVSQVRDDIRVLRDDIKTLRQDMREGFDELEERLAARMERNQQQLLDTLAGHTHDTSGTALFRSPPVPSP